MEPHPPTVGVDLSGGASTVANDELTTGADSVLKAFRGGFAPDPRSPAGRQALEGLRPWQARQTATAKGIEPPEDAEMKALRKSAKRLGRHLREGVSTPQATVLAHAHYRKHGGRSGIQVWARKISNPT